MVRLAWLLLALIHVLPAIALVRPALLTKLYGVELASPVYTLLWHRAALFVVILLICCWAAIRPEVGNSRPSRWRSAWSPSSPFTGCREALRTCEP